MNYSGRDDRHPTLETVEAIESAFGIPVRHLLMPGEVKLTRVAEPGPLDTELLATALAESADVFRSLNLMLGFKELASAAVHMYAEVQTGIPLRTAAAQASHDLNQIRRGTKLATLKESLGGGSNGWTGTPANASPRQSAN